MNALFGLDQNYTNLLEERFNEKKGITAAREKELCSIFNDSLSEEEEIALKYLYAYMPLNDLGDHDGKFFLSHVRKILEVRCKTPWGAKIPGRLFLHFVLPIRVNNENLEIYCDTFFDELFDRVKDLSMCDAILEINHWCHEKATYVGSDIRTISPLTLMKNGLGRCGEESVFTTAALRSLCIPARQCYTPRWAHCDSNHAWVEAWADGEWYFLGACEPEPKLNMGWFTSPAYRAMLVNTRVPGHYTGAEEVTLSDKWHTEINLLKGYTSIKKITVKVVDTVGKAVEKANVYFELYNTAEFFPIAKLTTDCRGEASLTTGFGDLLIHGFKDECWGEEKVRISDVDYVKISISQHVPETKVEEFDMAPPPERNLPTVSVTEEEVQRNSERLKIEDEIRSSHQRTFVSHEEAINIAKEINLCEDRVWDLLKKARGNSWVIALFLKQYGNIYGEMSLKLLESLNPKDLIDTGIETLADHLIHSVDLKGDFGEDTFVNYILCPRVYFEMLGAYREYFKGKFSLEEREGFKQNPKALVKWIKENIDLLQSATYYVGFASPKGSFDLRKADSFSRDILFVALARSFGIPARLEPTDKRPQYLRDSDWKDAFVSKPVEREENIPSGKIRLVRACNCNCRVKAEYFNNFSIGRFKNGIFQTLAYQDVGFEYFGKYFDLPEGYYRLVTGTRLSDGTVLVRVSLFEVKEGQNVDVDIIFREDQNNVENLGSISGLKGLTPLGKNSQGSISLNKNAIIAWIEPDREPSKHLIRELRELAEEMDKINPSVYICVGEDKLTPAFNADFYDGLPQGTIFAVDKAYTCFNSFVSAAKKELRINYPAVFVVDRNNNIRYASTGYKLGIGEEVLKLLQKLSKI